MGMSPRSDREAAHLNFSMAFDPALFSIRSQYSCAKSGVCACANSFCYVYCFKLDGDPTVEAFRYGQVRFPYYDPESRQTKYESFDFDVKLTDGSRRLVYVTTVSRLHTPLEESRIEAAEAHADLLGAGFRVVTELELFGTNLGYMRSIIRYYTERMWEKFKDEQEVDSQAGVG